MKAAGERLLVAPETPVTCPQCEHEFSLAQGFAKRALEGLEQTSAAALAELRSAERDEARKRVESLAAERTRGFEQQIADLKKVLLTQAEAAKAQAAEVFAQERGNFEKRLAEQSETVRALRAQELDLRREKTAVEDRAAGLEVEVVRKIDSQRAAIEAKVRAQEQERAALEKADLQKKLDDAGEQLAAAQRRMEQGSQQLQGEVLELAVEESLRRTFPIDAFEEVKKGSARWRHHPSGDHTHRSGGRHDFMGDQARQGLECAVGGQAQGGHARLWSGPRRHRDPGIAQRIFCRAGVRSA